jgi:transposase-like protein
VAESLDPATTSSAVARRYGLHASQLFVWRQQLQRYRGLARTHLRHVAAAAAIDLARLGDWFRAIPRAATRTSRFATLAA